MFSTTTFVAFALGLAAGRFLLNKIDKETFLQLWDRLLSFYTTIKTKVGGTDA